MIAKVTSINARYCNRFETALGMYLKHEIEKDPIIEIDSVREMFEVFKIENKGKFKNCNPDKIRIMYCTQGSKDFVHVLKASNTTIYSFYEIILIEFQADAIENIL